MAGERLSKALPGYRKRYRAAGRQERGALLDEFCKATGYHRKYAITLLGRPAAGTILQPQSRAGPGKCLGGRGLSLVGPAEGLAAAVASTDAPESARCIASPRARPKGPHRPRLASLRRPWVSMPKEGSTPMPLDTRARSPAMARSTSAVPVARSSTRSPGPGGRRRMSALRHATSRPKDKRRLSKS